MQLNEPVSAIKDAEKLFPLFESSYRAFKCNGLLLLLFVRNIANQQRELAVMPYLHYFSPCEFG